MTVARILGATALALSVAAIAHAGGAPAGPPSPCAEASLKRFGTPAGVAGKDLPAPRKVRDAQPDYPTRQGSSRALSSIWIGEALVDRDGTVREVWTLRPLRFEPAWPEFEAAIADAIRKWSYEPPLVDGAAVPMCVTVSVSINWR